MTNQKFKLKNLKSYDLDNYTPQDGEVIQTEDGKTMIWNNGEWKELKVEGSNLELGLYDLNKQIIAQLPTLTDFTQAINNVHDLHSEYQNRYYMMYGKEISYFTLFEVCGSNDFGQDVIDCCVNVGSIKAIDMTEAKDALEIWVHPQGEEPTCLYLFPYDSGIVKVGE